MWRKIIERLENCPPASFPPALLWGNVFKIAQYQPFFWRRWWIFIAFKIQIRSAYSFISRIRNFQLGRNNLQPFHSNNMDNAEKWLDGGEKNKTKERKWFRLYTIFWKLKLDTCARREFLIFFASLTVYTCELCGSSSVIRNFQRKGPSFEFIAKRQK